LLIRQNETPAPPQRRSLLGSLGLVVLGAVIAAVCFALLRYL
jgi:hypothetical protein